MWDGAGDGRVIECVHMPKIAFVCVDVLMPCTEGLAFENSV
jgi:hypothetical protein